jgi:hypothetical protein
VNPSIVDTLVDVRDRLAEQGPQYMPLAHAMHGFACEAAGYSGYTGVIEFQLLGESELDAIMESILMQEVEKQINKQRRVRRTTHQRSVEQSRWNRLRALLDEETTTVTPPPPPVESDGTDMCPAP